MRRLICSLFLLLSPLAASPIVHAVHLLSHPFNVSGGGRFQAKIDGSQTLFNLWCSDHQLTTTVPNSFSAYIMPLAAAAGSPGFYDVRYENATFKYGVDGDFTDAVMRYRMAAYLVTLYEESLGGGHGKNKAIQNAIWKALATKSNSYNTVHSSIDYFLLAKNYVTANPNASLFSQFAVVSGWKSPATSLADKGKGQVQTFLTTYAPVPEPGTYVLLATAVIFLCLLKRRFGAL